MKKLVSILFLAASVVLTQADVVTFRVYFTNAAGTTNGQSVTINGQTRNFTNNAASDTSRLITTSNTVQLAKTNFYKQAANWAWPGNLTAVYATSTNNAVDLIGQVGSNITFSIVGNYGYGVLYTQLSGTKIAVSYPLAYSDPALQTNIVTDLASNIFTKSTYLLLPGNSFMRHFIDDNGKQSVTNKLLFSAGILSATNYGTFQTATGAVMVLEGADDTANGGLYAVPGNAGILFSASGTSVAKLAPYNSFDAIPSLFDEGGTNFFDLRSHVEGYPSGHFLPTTLSNTLAFQLSSVLNLGSALNYFPVINSLGTGTTNTWASANIYSGYTELNNLVRFQNTNFIGGYTFLSNIVSATAGTMTVTNLSSTNFWGNLAGVTNLTGIWYGWLTNIASIHGSNVNFYGGYTTSLVHNASTISNSTTAGTFVLGGDISTPRYDFNTLGNGNNPGVVFGTNEYIRLTGTISANSAIVGVAGGRNGLGYLVQNDTGYTVSLAQNTVDATDVNRFSTFDAGDVAIPNKGWFYLKYDTSISRWKIPWTYPALVYATNAIASNAVASLNGFATNLTIAQLFTWTNNYGSNKTLLIGTNGQVYLGDSGTGGGGSATNAISTVSSNATSITTSAVELRFFRFSMLTNAAGVVSIAQDVTQSDLTGTNTAILLYAQGLFTNANTVGLTNNGGFTNNGDISLSGKLIWDSLNRIYKGGDDPGATANLIIGQTVTTASTNVVAGPNASSAAKPGGHLMIAGGRSTGNGIGGSLFLATAGQGPSANSVTNVWVPRLKLDYRGDFFNVSTGRFYMSNVISAVSTPVASDDAATKGYVDALLTSPTFTNSLTVIATDGNGLTMVPGPSSTLSDSRTATTVWIYDSTNQVWTFNPTVSFTTGFTNAGDSVTLGVIRGDGSGISGVAFLTPFNTVSNFANSATVALTNDVNTRGTESTNFGRVGIGLPLTNLVAALQVTVTANTSTINNTSNLVDVLSNSITRFTNSFAANSNSLTLGIQPTYYWAATTNTAITNVTGTSATETRSGSLWINNTTGGNITNYMPSGWGKIGPSTTNILVIPAGKWARINVETYANIKTNYGTGLEQ